MTTTTDYCGNAIYENGVLEKLLTEGGYITLADTAYHCYIQDHQGNNRLVVNQNGIEHILSEPLCYNSAKKIIKKTGIDTKEDRIIPVNSGIGQTIQLRVSPYLPSDAYRAIKQNNPKGYEIKIK